MNFWDWFWAVLATPVAFFCLLLLISLFVFMVILTWAIILKVIQTLWRRHKSKKIKIDVG